MKANFLQFGQKYKSNLQTFFRWIPLRAKARIHLKSRLLSKNISLPPQSKHDASFLIWVTTRPLTHKCKSSVSVAQLIHFQKSQILMFERYTRLLQHYFNTGTNTHIMRLQIGNCFAGLFSLQSRMQNKVQKIERKWKTLQHSDTERPKCSYPGLTKANLDFRRGSFKTQSQLVYRNLSSKIWWFCLLNSEQT